MEEKQCGICGMFQAIGCFPTGYKTKDGLGTYCKKCNSAKRKQWRELNRSKANSQALEYAKANKDKRRRWVATFKSKNKDQIKAESSAYRKKNPWQHTQTEAKRRAIKRASIVESDLTAVKQIYKNARSELVIACEYCGLETTARNRHVDHKVPLARGGSHTSDNLAIACDKCNLRKGAKLLCQLGGAS